MSNLCFIVNPVCRFSFLYVQSHYGPFIMELPLITRSLNFSDLNIINKGETLITLLSVQNTTIII